jgi:DNA-binding NarL/FixJ family response regulator
MTALTQLSLKGGYSSVKSTNAYPVTPRLVADGPNNKQIGARLFISERTVESHVHSILNKLGFNSRAQIAGWMAVST